VVYLAHVHPGSCEDKDHHDPLEDETADHLGHDHGHDEHTHELGENDEASAGGIEYPFTPVKSNAAGEGSSATLLEGVVLGELLSDESKYLNVHAAGSGEQAQLACVNLR
jgi:hypothetical protein